MKITITGVSGSGISTVSKLLAEKLNYKHYSAGNMRREMAKQRGVDIHGLNKIGMNDSSTDNIVDFEMERIGKEQDNFVFDAKIGYHFIPDSYKIFLTGDLNVRAKRVFDARRGSEKYETINQAKEMIEERKNNDYERYLKHYNFKLFEDVKFDLIVDTTNILPEQVVEKILENINK
ncbi:MAG: (d)CMP kinase [Nanoarchaeota archaeon]|nr:(d)CMP kinase [Nanoarchaeota archaeon]MBU1269840.1 (d)CMP kinase [Nanoarchaeota archaeon]MBU1605148.1 (d)CMP kinase [Nanoarchaeota archaeon]MBU2442963.1 (d)CMP kinase [Nanoarchaeota archaeon]